MHARRAVSVFLFSAAAAGCAAGSNPAIDLAAEETAIRAIDQQMLAAANARDAAAFSAVFAPDGALLFPNQPAAIGTEAIRAVVQRDFAVPDFAVTWTAEEYRLAASGDLATSRGTYYLSLSTPDGPFEDQGKFLTVWRKVDGAWRVAADMINSDVPLPD